MKTKLILVILFISLICCTFKADDILNLPQEELSVFTLDKPTNILILKDGKRIKEISQFKYGISGMFAVVTMIDGSRYYLGQQYGCLFEYGIPIDIKIISAEIYNLLKLLNDKNSKNKVENILPYFSEKSVKSYGSGYFNPEKREYHYDKKVGKLLYNDNYQETENVLIELEYVLYDVNDGTLGNIAFYINDENYIRLNQYNYEISFHKENGVWKINQFWSKIRG